MNTAFIINSSFACHAETLAKGVIRICHSVKIAVHSCSFVVNRSQMKSRFTSTIRFSALAATLLCTAALPPARATTPQYQIFDIGVVQQGDEASQGVGVSPGGIAVGRSL